MMNEMLFIIFRLPIQSMTNPWSEQSVPYLGQVNLIFCLVSPDQILNAKGGESFLFFIYTP